MESLGKWVSLIYHTLAWFYDLAEDISQHVTKDGVDYYHRTIGRMRTRGTQHYEYLRSKIGARVDDRPASILKLSSTFVRYLGFGPPMATGPYRSKDFYKHLRS
jgi:hypothetical protein